MKNNLSEILQRIAMGEIPDSQELLPFLTVESAKDRSSAHANIALACLKANTPEHIKISREFIQRAWLQSGFDERLLPLYEKIHDALDDVESIREAYKRLGIHHCKQGNFRETLQFFDLWQNAYGKFRHLDKYSYDFDILDCMEHLASPYRVGVSPIEPLNGRKIRLAYLMRGILDVNSALVRFDINFASYHDKSHFEVVYFVLENRSAVNASLHATKTICSIENYGFRLVAAPDIDDLLEKFLSLNQLICEYRPDIFITSAALADFGNCFVTMLRPAPLSIAFVSGPPPQFVIPNCHDCGIGWIDHPLMDSPLETKRIRPYPEIPDRLKIVAANRIDYNIPESACLLICTGRTQKFQHQEFWKSVSRILEAYHGCHLMVVGVTEEYIACLENTLPKRLRSRTHFIAWNASYLSLLSMADVALDTYPSGGGGTLLDSMAIGLPIVTFKNDYLHQFDQTDWSVAEEVLMIDELIAPRGDMATFEKIVGRLIEDKTYRQDIGERCAAKVKINKTNNEQIVKELENIYRDQLEKKLLKHHDTNTDALKKFPIEWLRYENYQAWQKAYIDGYASNMGDHRNAFYNKYLEEIGLYKLLIKAQRIVEFAPGNGDFIAPVIQANPQKEFFLVDISEKNLYCLSQRFGNLANVRLILNDRMNLSLESIDSVFSFLLCQQMPLSLWKEHVNEVYRMLAPGGSYVFQFAYHCDGELANDSIPVSIAGSQKYSVDSMNRIVNENKFKEIFFTNDIKLQRFNTNMIWYLCKVVK